MTVVMMRQMSLDNLIVCNTNQHKNGGLMIEKRYDTKRRGVYNT